MFTLRCSTQRYLPCYEWADGAASQPLSRSQQVEAAQDSVVLSGLGDRLAQSTLEAASRNQDLSRMRCYHFVKAGLRSEGICLRGKSAYQAASQLADDGHFQELFKVRRDKLAELPAGAIVVWNRNGRHPDGHISVALGDGREVSDRIRPQIVNYASSYRVFLPQEDSRHLFKLPRHS